MRHTHGGYDHHRRQDVGQDFLQHNVTLAGPHRVSGLDIFDVARGEGLTAHHATRDHPFLICQREDDVLQTRSGHGYKRDGENQIWEPQQNIYQTRDDHINPTAKVSGGKARQHADCRRNQDHAGTNEDRHARTIDNARENIASQRVGSQNI